MNLSRKTLVYSSIISIIIVSLIIGYFILMLPSLYVSYMQERNYNSIVNLQKGFLKSGSYDNLEVKNPSGTITVALPMTGDALYVISKIFHITVDIQDQDLLDLMNKFRYYANHMDELENFQLDEIDFDQLKDKFLKNEILQNNGPLKVQFELYDTGTLFKEVSSKLHQSSKNFFVFESNITDGYNNYTSYIAVGKTKDSIAITMMPLMTPSMDEIKPVIVQSLPMIVAMAFLLVLVSSQVFSKLIINPIIRLANHAEFMRESRNLKLQPLTITGHDEISSLADSLNRLYEKIQDNYQELEQKNQYLAEENKRQEIFLRASSHQLKTPVTAALLLVQGMIGEVGKYKDVKAYLPQVKKQLQSMQKIVEDILYLNHCSKNLLIEPVSMEELMEECKGAYGIQTEEKALILTREGQMPILNTDRELMKKILDNLLSNAIHFTPAGGKIHITYEKNRLCIFNYGVTIEEELLPHIFEPFVTSNDKNKAHGLGLYVVAYYAQLLDYKVRLSNIGNGVMAELILT